MLRLIARRYAKAAYVFRQEQEAATNDLNAGLALRTAAEKHDLAKQLTQQADQMDARIREMDTSLTEGFYECENGHEAKRCACAIPPADALVHVTGCPREPINGVIKCPTCSYPLRFLKRDQMTDEEERQSLRERLDAQQLAHEKRAQAKAEEENAANSEKTAQYFKGIAAKCRDIADKVRRL